MKIIITVDDVDSLGEAADYVEHVAREVRDGFIEGHVNSMTHWRIAD